MAVSTIKRRPTVANNLTTTTEGSVLDARQGKVLSDKIANLVVVKSFSCNVDSVSSGGTKTVNASALNYEIPEGYFPIGMVYISLGADGLLLQRVNLTDESASIVKFKNTTSGTLTDKNVEIRVAFMKVGMIDNQIPAS